MVLKRNQKVEENKTPDLKQLKRKKNRNDEKKSESSGGSFLNSFEDEEKMHTKNRFYVLFK